MNDDGLKIMISEILNITSSLSSTDSLLQPMKEFFSTTSPTGVTTSAVFTSVQNIMKDTVFAIGASLLSLFMLMELVALLDRVQGESGLSGFKLPVTVLMKWGVFTFLYCNLNKILLGIQEFMLTIANGINTAAGGAGAGNVTAITPGTAVDSIMSTITGLGLVQKLFISLIITIIWVMIHCIVMAMNVTINFRVFEMLVMFMFAPIPLATLPSPDFKQTAFNFLKGFAAISMQSAIILGCFFLYNKIAVNNINSLCTSISGTNAVELISKCLIPIMGWTCVLAISVFKSGSISKSILNAM